MLPLRSLGPWLVALVCLLEASCSGGGAGGALSLADFQLTGISVPEAGVWQINRPMTFTFSGAVDFATVGPNTIHIQTPEGIPAGGVFSRQRVDRDGDGLAETSVPEVVVFQPTCPTRADKSDAGLRPGGERYVITVVGRSSNALDTVRSAEGKPLQETQTRSFVTPLSEDDQSAFLDPVPGPPLPVLRTTGSTREEGVSYFECGGDPDQRVFFEFDPLTQAYGLSEAGFEAPLNLYSDPSSKLAVVLAFNQPVSIREDNISSDFVRLEYTDGQGLWRPFETRVTLVENCSGSGAVVRLDPIGILPVASMVRAVIQPGFRDLTGREDNPLPLDDFAVAPTTNVFFSSLSPPEDSADAILECFTVGGDEPGSREDTEIAFDTAAAAWGGGKLAAGFSFDGNGGPNGTFDWIVRSNQVVFLDTISDQIVGGENGAPEAIQNVIGGVVDVRDLIIEEGGLLRALGANPLRISASRDVIIRGTLDVSGGNAKNVSSLNTGNQPEPGGPGTCGGGKGGAGSIVTNSSTPNGQRGFGPFGEPNTGGVGGESGYSPSNIANNRRPGGGGGGRLAADLADSVYGPGPDALDGDVFGLRAEQGNQGNNNATGALTNLSPPMGGLPGGGPLGDGDPENDFWGTRAIAVQGSSETRFVRGELLDLTAGYGGGAGGDACTGNTFPTPNWTIASDEKGGGGGGGGGALHIKALGRIVFGENGTIDCGGGQGATGENTGGFDHNGGGGGGGSGGHVVLETATRIDFTDGDPARDWGVNPFLTEDEEPFFGGRPRILANGGDGATFGPGGLSGGSTTPPGLGYGGDGGPGIIQLHVPDPTRRPAADASQSNIVVPLQTELLMEDDPQMQLRSIMAPGGIPLIPSFGARSRARSDWITLGAADQSASGGFDQVLFAFGGIDPATGRIQTQDGFVLDPPPVLEGLFDADLSVNAAGDALTLGGAALEPLIDDPGSFSNDVYLRTPTLLERFVLRLSVDGSPGIMRSFDVVAASYDDAAAALTLLVDVGVLGNTIQRFLDDNAGGAVRYELVPRFFAVVTDGVEGLVGENASVTISFQATGADSEGNPDEQDILVDFTSDVSELNAQAPGAIRFVRFEVGFDLAGGEELSVETVPVTLDFLRVPFRF